MSAVFFVYVYNTHHLCLLLLLLLPLIIGAFASARVAAPDDLALAFTSAVYKPDFPNKKERKSHGLPRKSSKSDSCAAVLGRSFECGNSFVLYSGFAEEYV